MGLVNSNKVSTSQVLPRTRSFVFSCPGKKITKVSRCESFGHAEKKKKRAHQTPNKKTKKNHQ